MTSMELVSSTHSALVAGDLAGHLAHVSAAVQWQVNDGDLKLGKEQYSAFIAPLLRRGTIKQAISIEEVPTDNDDGVTAMIVRDARQVPAPSREDRGKTREEIFDTRYEVKQSEVIKIHFAMFVFPRSYSYKGRDSM